MPAQLYTLFMGGRFRYQRVLPEWVGLKTGPAITFVLFWLLNMFVVYLGVDSIKKLLVFKAFFLPIAALALLFWAIQI